MELDVISSMVNHNKMLGFYCFFGLNKTINQYLFSICGKDKPLSIIQRARNMTLICPEFMEYFFGYRTSSGWMKLRPNYSVLDLIGNYCTRIRITSPNKGHLKFVGFEYPFEIEYQSGITIHDFQYPIRCWGFQYYYLHFGNTTNEDTKVHRSYDTCGMHANGLHTNDNYIYENDDLVIEVDIYRDTIKTLQTFYMIDCLQKIGRIGKRLALSNDNIASCECEYSAIRNLIPGLRYFFESIIKNPFNFNIK